MARANDPEDDEDAPEAAPPRRPRSSRRPPPRPRAPRPPVRRWRSADDADDGRDEEEEERSAEPRRRGLFSRERHPVYWRARDSLYFEPLVAVAIVVVLLVSLYAYTQNWPPVYVIESDSMQHGASDVLGVINTGDLVLAQKIPTDQITPYVVGLATGYSTYGEYGDVLLYLPDGQGSTPIIHRAILYLQWNPASSTYNATELSGLRCGNDSGAIYNSTSLRGGQCGTTGLTGTLDLYRIGYRSATLSIPLASLGDHSGFLTMGDHNVIPTDCTNNCIGEPDQTSGLSELVEPGWIVGVARGMIPWVGAVKLLLEGDAGMVPAQSWQFLGLTIVGLILLAFGIHYALRTEGIEDERRKEEEAAVAEEEADDEDDRTPGRARRFLHAIRPWGRSEDEDDVDEPPRRPKRPAAPGPRDRRRGRPTPHVRRDAKAKRAKASEDDDEDL